MTFSRMMGKREGGLVKVIAYLLLCTALIHGFIHVVLFETSLSLVKTAGLSGFVVGEVNSEQFEENIKSNEQASKSSLVILGGEWLILISLILISVMRSHQAVVEQKNQHIEIVRKKGISETDIDVLYQLLQKNKKIAVTKAAQLFNVDKEIIKEWGEMLENNGLAIVDYPRFGEVEIRINEKT